MTVPVVYFNKTKNIGDIFNITLLNYVLGEPVELVSENQPHLLCTGSIVGKASRESYICGSGIISEDSFIPKIDKDKVFSVRGELTLGRLKDKFGLDDSKVALGDPGLLLPLIYSPSVNQVKGRVGVIFHYMDRRTPLFKSLEFNEKLVDLNVHAGVEEFVDKLLTCEVVVSSSLHGLIFAEAYSIPSSWLEVSDKVAGNGYKFYDFMTTLKGPLERNRGTSVEDLWIAIDKAQLRGINVETAQIQNSIKRAYSSLKSRQL